MSMYRLGKGKNPSSSTLTKSGGRRWRCVRRGRYERPPGHIHVLLQGLSSQEVDAFVYSNLIYAQVQVVVMRANMGCSHCRGRVSQVVSKMNAGLLDFVVDRRKKEVVVTGVVDVKRRKSPRQQLCSHRARKKPSASFNPLRLFLCSSGM